VNTLKATYLALSLIISPMICAKSTIRTKSDCIDCTMAGFSLGLFVSSMMCAKSEESLRHLRATGAFSIFYGTALGGHTLWRYLSNKKDKSSVKIRERNWFDCTRAAGLIIGGGLLLSSYRPTTKISRGF